MNDVATKQARDGRRRPPITREQVLRSALELADADGIEALTMRRLGHALGVDPMAIYRHVRSKGDLLDVVAEAIVGEIAAPPPGDDWKATVRSQALSARAVMLRHPWARRVVQDRAPTGTWLIGYVDVVLGTLRAGGFSVELAHHALHVLGPRIFGFTQDLIDDSGPPPPPSAAAAMTRMLAGYPHAAELAREVSHGGVLGPCDDDFEFAFGLELILDGLDRVRTTS
jgi:AcrR family transcriptional regulator